MNIHIILGIYVYKENISDHNANFAKFCFDIYTFQTNMFAVYAQFNHTQKWNSPQHCFNLAGGPRPETS